MPGRMQPDRGADAALRFSGKADSGTGFGTCSLWKPHDPEFSAAVPPGQMPHRAFPARRTAGTGFGTCGLWKPHDPEFSAAVPPGRMLRAASQGFRVRFVCFAPSCRKSVSGVCRSRGLCLRGLLLRRRAGILRLRPAFGCNLYRYRTAQSGLPCLYPQF